MKMFASYAFRERKGISNRFELGEGLVGQCALEKERILITGVPDNYIKINSGLGEGTPLNIVVLPVLFEGEVKAVCELASFQSFSEIHLALLDQLTESIGIALNTISATMRTEELLRSHRHSPRSYRPSRKSSLRRTAASNSRQLHSRLPKNFFAPSRNSFRRRTKNSRRKRFYSPSRNRKLKTRIARWNTRGVRWNRRRNSLS